MTTESTEDRDGQVTRVETLLAAVRDIVSSLHSMSSQLEREVGEVLGERQLRPSGATTAAVEALELENAQLKEALEGRAVIERAKGLLMASYSCDEDAAFHLLVGLSRQERRKLRAVAADLVERHRETGGTGTGASTAVAAARPLPEGLRAAPRPAANG
jgi:hypothetical protein